MDADVAVMMSAGDPTARGAHEARGSIFTEALDGV